ncbi:hypothetical protein [Tessaracoccus massiliensis]|uniref:hypothetical protein n=1 Tax=Tessaracoccus massiliensis TaxID=1522311 RepID=UPI0005902FB7|nr:hypothetical protein [Tessaracoccus massiliensis]
MSTKTDAPAKPVTTSKPKPRRSKVDHLYWVPEGEAAKSMGIFEVPSICRRAWLPLGSPQFVAPDRQGRATNLAPKPCRECVRIAEARWRRQLEGRD